VFDIAEYNDLPDTKQEHFFCRFSLSGKILGGVGGQSCPGREDGPAGAKLTLTPLMNGESSGEAYISETSAGGSYKFENLVPGNVLLSPLVIICDGLD
jgi:hypothetical protein